MKKATVSARSVAMCCLLALSPFAWQEPIAGRSACDCLWCLE